GLSPEEITACLKRVEQQHGPSVLAVPVSAAAMAAAERSSSASKTSWGSVVKITLRRYGAVALVMTLLAVGYAHFQQAQRRSRRSAKVANMLALLGDQQAQYAQAAALLHKRVAKFQAAQHATAAPPAALQSAAALERQIELEALKQELLELKGAMVDVFVHPGPKLRRW
ncbi:hypothetical protein PybrP1_000999, partial [[Pythium] brassicae (nom. inval.)]